MGDLLVPGGIRDLSLIHGDLHIELFHNFLDEPYRDPELIWEEYVHNLITTDGDQYYAAKGITGISPANPAAPTAASGMKLGQGSTAASKDGAGAALIT